MNKRAIMAISMMVFFGLMGCTAGTYGTKTGTPPPKYAKALNLYNGLEVLSEKLINSTKVSAKEQRIQKIAVADFTGPGDKITGLGEHISDKLSVRLFSSGEFPDFMERRQLKQVIQTHKNELSGYFDQDTVKKFGKKIGIDSMVIGIIKDLGSFFDVTAKIVESESGRILGMADVRLIKDDTTLGLVGKKKYAALSISVDPAVSGKVVAGGKQGYLENGVVTITGIPYGECQVIIQPQGYDTVRKSIPIRSPSEAFSVTLESKKYDVCFQIVPPDAHLTVNGENILLNSQGFANIKNLKGQECSYVVKAEGHKYKPGSFNPANENSIIINLQAKDSFYEVKNKFFQKYMQVEKHQDFSVRLWTDKTAYSLGDPIYFYFRSEKNCYINLVNIGSSGDVTLIFPNRYHSDNYVRGGVTYCIPGEDYGFEFKVEPPVGNERVYAIASTQHLDIFKDDFRKGDFINMTRGKTRDIGVHQLGSRLDRAKLNAAAECIVNKIK